jgi:hypothetical protein
MSLDISHGTVNKIFQVKELMEKIVFCVFYDKLGKKYLLILWNLLICWFGNLWTVRFFVVKQKDLWFNRNVRVC